MSRSPLILWLKTANGLTAAIVTVLCGLLVGTHTGFTLGKSLTQSYRLDFSGAHWIHTAAAGDTGYFRKRFYITSTVRQAWIQVAATDGYDAYVNGVQLRVPAQPGVAGISVTALFVSTEPTKQFDITPYLIRGENSITINVYRRIKTRLPELLVKGYVCGTDESQWIYSDATWKAKTQPDDQVGSQTWVLPHLDDSTWPDALASDRTVSDTDLLPVGVSPAVLQHVVEGGWIGSPVIGARQTCFKRDFTVPWGADSTWLEINATGDYRIYLNGELVTRSDLVLYLQPSLAMGSINLFRWLNWGTNRLEIQVENSATENALLANLCFVRGNKVTSIIASDSSWQVQSIPQVGNNAAWSSARELANYGDPPFGNQMKLGYQPLLSTSETSRRNSETFVMAALAFVVWCILWIWFSNRLANWRRISLDQALTVDALAQIPVGIAAGLLILASYDVQIRPEAPFQFYIWVGLILFSILLRWKLWWSRPATLSQSLADRLPVTREFIRNYGFGIALAAIVMLAFVLRVSGLMNYPLDHDEVFMRNVSHGIIERGYPSLAYKGEFFRLSTYELVPWPEAFCAILTGWPDWSLRVPALLFGTAVCGLLGVIGSRMFNRRTGLLAALIYACLAFDVLWSRHCFHLQQTQFFALLCFYTFYESIWRGNGVDRRYFPAACVLFCLTYLSWEGSGFILPVFAIVLVLMNLDDWRWLRQFHFWVGLFFVTAVVLIQLSGRAVLLPPYLAMGYGLADISGPKLNFLDQRNNDFFYFDRLMLMSSHVILSILAMAGLLLLWRHKPTRYVLLVFFLLLLCYSNLLPIFSIRYCYFYQTLLVLGGCAVIIQFYDHITRLLGAMPQTDWIWVGRWAQKSLALVMVVMFLAASEIGIKIYRVEQPQGFPAFMTRYNDSYYDYQTPSVYVSEQLKPGDAVITLMPDTYAHFTGKSAAECDTTLDKRVVFEPEYDTPVFIDGHSGSVVIRDGIQLRDIYSRHNRVWFIAEAISLFNKQDRDTVAFVQNISRVVYENASGSVYLWDGGGDPATAVTLTPPVLPGPYGALVRPDISESQDTPSIPTTTPKQSVPILITPQGGL